MEYLHQEWSPKRRTWEPAGEEPARYPWRRVLADRPEPVPAAYRRPARTPGPLDYVSKARHMAAWIARSGAPVCTVFTAPSPWGTLARFNAELQRELARLGWRGQFAYANPTDWDGPPVDLGPEYPATTREESQSCLL